MNVLVDAALVRIGGPLNARPLGSAPASTEARALADVARDVEAARDAGAKAIVFVGGEPTVRRDLAALLALPRRLGLACGVVTSGRALAYPAVRAKLVAAEVRYLRVALHAAEAALHDALVGVEGAFAQTLEGLSALALEAGPELLLDVACTVVAANVEALAPLAERVARTPHRASMGLRFVAPLAGLDEHEWPTRDCVARVSAAIDRALAIAPDLAVAWEGFAPCLLAAHAARRDEVLRWGAPASGPAIAGAALVREEPLARAKPYPCQDCLHEATCVGAPSQLLARWGERSLAPARGVRANSFNFEHVESLGAIAPSRDRCAIRARLPHADAIRDLVLLRDGEAARYHSPTSDFVDAEIRRTARDLEQVYLDVTHGAALADFENGVRRARPHPICEACVEREACPRAWVVDPEPPFAEGERRLRDEIARLRGRVLDVGCGEQPYRAEIAAAIADGRVAYEGLDPDAAALARFREAVPGATLHACDLESFEAAEGAYDAALVFRSLNHLRDLERAFAALERVVRPGGVVVVQDDVAYATLRTRAQVAFADAHAPVGHEHFRNWSSEQLVDFVRRFAFRVDVHRQVGRHTSNQWFVRLVRSG